MISPLCETLKPVMLMNSIWQNTSLPRFPRLSGDKRTDVLIIGGGMAGLLCGYLLSQAGVDTLLVEENRICGGVTGRTTAKITAQHGLIYHKLLHKLGTEKARMYLDANREALSMYRQLCKKFPCGFEEQSNYVYTLADGAILDRELAALHRLGFSAHKQEELPLPFPTAGAVVFRQQGQFHPLEFAEQIAKSLHIFENTSVRYLDGTTAVTDHAKVRAKQVIVATHFPFLNRHGSYFLKLYQQRSYVLALEGGPILDGMYVCGESGGHSFRNADNFLLLGGNSHRTGKQTTGWQPLEDLVRKYYPDAAESCRWATQDCMSLDGVPYIGQYSARTPGVYVATGFNKWGMTGSMTAAMLLRDQILDKNNPYKAVFNPSRSILTPQLAINGIETAMNLLRLKGPRCPHLGCALQWNKAEHSWDCPCHGSRFNEAGKKLNNPSQKNLER